MENFPEQVILLIAGLIKDVDDIVALTVASKRFYLIGSTLLFQGNCAVISLDLIMD